MKSRDIIPGITGGTQQLPSPSFYHLKMAIWAAWLHQLSYRDPWRIGLNELTEKFADPRAQKVWKEFKRCDMPDFWMAVGYYLARPSEIPRPIRRGRRILHGIGKFLFSIRHRQDK